jgi:peptide/nickel transport system permease protein
MWGVAALWAIVTVAFFLNEVIPADPAAMVAGPMAGPEDVARVRTQLGLDEPVGIRYAIFLRRLVHLAPRTGLADDHGSCAIIGPLHIDLGQSYVQRRPVVDILGERFPRSALLALGGVAVETMIALLIGTFAATKSKTGWESAALAATLVGTSVPSFLIGIALQYGFSNVLHWLPLDGIGNSAGEEALTLILPSLTLGLSWAAYAALLVRDEVALQLGLDHARTARAKGASFAHVLTHHVLRNSLAPIVTLTATNIGVLLGGAVVVETMFRWPGIGQASVTALLDRDGPLVMGTVIVAASAVVLANVAVDLLLPWLDPRLRRS